MGGGIGMGNTCKPMAVLFQCMTKFTTNKKKKIIYKKKKALPGSSDGQLALGPTIKGALAFSRGAPARFKHAAPFPFMPLEIFTGGSFKSSDSWWEIMMIDGRPVFSNCSLGLAFHP